MRQPILAMAAALAAGAALSQGCQPEPLVPAGGPGAAGSPGAAGTNGAGGRTGTGGMIDTLGIGAHAGGGNGMNCGAVPALLPPVPPDVLILLDASGSMNNDADDTTCNNGCGASSKWALAMPAINAVVAETAGSINWGLKFFAEDATCGVNNGVAVQVASSNAGAIATAIMGRTSANGGVSNGSRTPTRLAENAGAAYLRGLTDMSPRFLLLVTDGLPNCMPGSSDSAADDSAGAVAAVADASAAGIPTMVIGVSTGGTPADTTLSDLAVAGGYPRASSPAYYPVSSTAELTAALHSLIDMTPDCIFALPIAPNGADYRFGVVVDGTEIPRDVSHASGWDYTSTSQTAIEIYGPICDGIKTGTVTSVQVVFKCNPI